MPFYPAALPLSSPTLKYTASLIRHRARIGSPWRKLNPAQQALAYLRKGETFADLAAGFGIGTATARWYVTETAGLLAARSPRLRAALAQARRAGHAYLIIDGTLVPINRVRGGLLLSGLRCRPRALSGWRRWLRLLRCGGPARPLPA